MLKRRIVFSVLILAVVLLTPVTAQGKDTLAVLDFTTEAVSATEMNAIVEYLSAELFNTNKFIVIDVSQRETILQEMEFSMSGCSDDSCALEIGKMLSAEMIVVGNLSKVGSRYLVTAKMLQTETSRTMGTANGKYGDLDELIDGLEGIAVKLSGGALETVAAAPEPESESVKAVPEAAEEVSEPVAEPSAKDPAQIARDAAAASKAANDEEKKASSGGSGNTGLAIGLTAGGVVALGVGGYFLYDLFVNSLPVYTEARREYSDAFAETSDFDQLYQVSADAYDEAILDFSIGTVTAGAGVILTVIGVMLFSPPENNGTAVSFTPIISRDPGLIVRVSY